MIWLLLLAAGLWWLGHLFGAPRKTRLAMLAILYLAVLIALWLAPAGSPLPDFLGGSAAEWALLGGAAIIAWAYGRVVAYLRARAKPAERPETGPFSKTELNRYARHIVLREIGGPGQRRLKEARVLVIGAGGLGSPALLYLAAAGIGTIGVIDDDVVDNSNLQRQVIHKDAAIGTPKVFSAEAEMRAQNPAINVRPYHRKLTDEIAAELFAEYDLVLDGSDNFDTRYLANRVAARAGIPLISGALSQWEGQVSLFNPAAGGPCYECVFPTRPVPGLAPSCAEAGVVGPLPGVVGSIMALETVKYLTGAGETFEGRMLIYDGLYGESRVMGLKRRDDCPVCQSLAASVQG